MQNTEIQCNIIILNKNTFLVWCWGYMSFNDGPLGVDVHMRSHCVSYLIIA